jgi:transcriptional regulator with XRE-family HTH domain
MFMSRPSNANDALPFAAEDALKRLGASLRVARERRGESLRSWAERMNTSVPTLSRMESGDPAVGMGVYATALWIAGKAADLGALAAPEKDSEALAMDVRRAQRSRPRP